MKRKYWLTILFVLVGVFFLGSGGGTSAGAQSLTHTVKKGDTLWNICDKYYGDPDLWPKLWQMNPFITNPHLLEPGDAIVLLKDRPVKEFLLEERKAETQKEPDDASRDLVKGVDVSGWVNVDAMGFLATEKIVSAGQIISSGSDRVMLAEGDEADVSLKKGEQGKPGDLFTVFRMSPLLRHPLTGEKSGYAVSFIGRIVLGKSIKEGLYRSEIVESYKPLQAGDHILAYEPVSACVLPLPVESGLTSNIISDKDQRDMMAQSSVVYLGHGFNQGVRRGNVFEVLDASQSVSPDEPASYVKGIGYILVVEARPDTATCVVVSSDKELARGLLVRGADSTKARGVFSMMPECFIE